MTPAQAKRAAFLLKSREDLKYELATEKPDAEEWKHNGDARPLPLLEDDVELEVNIGDGNGSLHTIATVDVGVLRKACAFMLYEVEKELTSLGVELD